MPCVLPVLSIKVLSLITHKEDANKAWINGLIFTSGVLASFWILAGLLIALKAAGQQIGWGFQFQSPVFVIALSILLLGMALNLFGVFEIGASLTKLGGAINLSSGYRGSFLSGILATVVATPCTAPFMGTALGFALTQSAINALLIFTFLGLGMAFPFLILCRFPRLLKFVPRPGPWMTTFKKFLGALLLVTVTWLLWVLSLQLNAGQTTVSNKGEGIAWQPYSAAYVTELKTGDEPVFIDFTAAWCLNCQVNDRVVFHNKDVIKKFKELGIVAVKADWTNYDEEITQALASYGKNSIPLYVLYGKDKSQEPYIFPEIITPSLIIKALEEKIE
jgi:thiol:disulfide interchange protein DsbD